MPAASASMQEHDYRHALEVKHREILTVLVLIHPSDSRDITIPNSKPLSQTQDPQPIALKTDS